MINGQLLARFRERAGLEPQRAADQLIITKRSLYSYEAGTPPRLDVFKRMADLYELSPLEVCLVLRIIPSGLTYGDMLKFAKSCAIEKKSSGTVLGEFIRAYSALMRKEGVGDGGEQVDSGGN